MSERTFHLAIQPAPRESSELTVLYSGNSETNPHHKVGPRVIDNYLVHYVVSGTGTLYSWGQEYRLQRGSSFFIFPGELVCYISDSQDPWSYRWIGFGGSCADQYVSQLDIYPHAPVIPPGKIRRKIPFLFRLIEQSLRFGDAQSELRSSAYMHLLFTEYFRERRTAGALSESDSDTHQTVERMKQWMQVQYAEAVSIEQMAKALGYHSSYLSRVFKRHTGLTPTKYLLKIRMERAAGLLGETFTIEQIASSVGYSDSLYFSKQFKLWYGCSPSDFRSALRGR